MTADDEGDDRDDIGIENDKVGLSSVSSPILETDIREVVWRKVVVLGRKVRDSGEARRDELETRTGCCLAAKRHNKVKVNSERGVSSSLQSKGQRLLYPDRGRVVETSS